MSELKNMSTAETHKNIIKENTECLKYCFHLQELFTYRQHGVRRLQIQAETSLWKAAICVYMATAHYGWFPLTNALI